MDAARSARPGNPSAEGMALVLATGLSTAILLTAVTAVQLSQILALRTALKARAARAELAADSGIRYAEARLLERPYPRFRRRPSGRADDWTSRDADNPSFSRSEPWTDANDDGYRDPNEAVLDLDGDGKFSAWTGRLRDGQGPFALRFSLSAESPGGKVPVNAGSLEIAHHNRADGTHLYHAGLARVLDNLGALLLATGEPGRADFPTGEPVGSGEPIRISRLGSHLLADRPQGGYRSLDAVGAALAGRGYSEAARAAVLPFLDAGPSPATAEGSRLQDAADPSLHVPYVPVEMASAHPKVLAALWTYAARDAALEGNWNRPYGRTGGLTYLQTGSAESGPGTVRVVLFPDEAEALANLAVALRRDPLYDWDWRLLHQRMVLDAEDLFRKDLAELADAPLERESLAIAKAKIAFHAVAMDAENSPGALPGTGSSWGMVAKRQAAIDAYTTAQVVAWFPPRGVVRGETAPAGIHLWHALPFPPEGGDYASGSAPFTAAPHPLSPQGLTLSPPSAFEVAVTALLSGTARTRDIRSPTRARLTLSERIDCFSQEDFENGSGGPALAGRGIYLWDPEPTARRNALEDSVANADDATGWTVREYPHTATGPRWNARSGSGGPFPRHAGWVALAGREGGPQGAGHYWPFREDADDDPATDFRSEPEGVASVRLTIDAAASGPWDVSSSSPQALDCPGITPGAFLDAFTVEAWLTLPPAGAAYAKGSGEPVPTPILATPLSSEMPDEEPDGFEEFVRLADTGGSQALALSWKRETANDGSAGTRFKVKAWGWTGESDPTLAEAFVPDAGADPASAPPSEFFHVVFTLRCADAALTPKQEEDADAKLTIRKIDAALTDTKIEAEPETEEEEPADSGIRNYYCGLYINGGGPTGAKCLAKAELFPASALPLQASVRRVDELRLYDRAIDWAENDWVDDRIRARYALGRFVSPAEPAGNLQKNPTFRSPRYLFDSRAQLLSAQWTGITDAALDEAVRMRVTLYGYDRRNVLASGYPAVLDASGRTEALPRSGDIRSFEYVVEFHRASTTGDPPPLFSTPFFQSIWIAFRRPDRLGTVQTWRRD